MRSNAEKFKLEFAKAWEDGTAGEEIRKFLPCMLEPRLGDHLLEGTVTNLSLA